MLGSSALLRQRRQSHELLISLFADADERDQSAAPQCATQWLTIFGCCSDLPRLFMGAGRKIFRGGAHHDSRGVHERHFPAYDVIIFQFQGGCKYTPLHPLLAPMRLLYKTLLHTVVMDPGDQHPANRWHIANNPKTSFTLAIYIVQSSSYRTAKACYSKEHPTGLAALKQQSSYWPKRALMTPLQRADEAFVI